MTQTTPNYGFPLPSDQSRISAFPFHLRALSRTLEERLPESLLEAGRRVSGEILSAFGWRAATNLVHNGEFMQVFEGWNYYGGTGSTIPGAVAVTGSGATSGVGLYTAPGYRRVAQGGHRLYVEARMRFRKAGATTMRVELSDGVTRLNAVEVKPPSLDLWTIVRGVTVVPDSFDGRGLQVYPVAYWPDAATAAGAVVEIDHVLVIDLTETYGAGREPGASEVAALVQAAGGFFDGTVARFDKSGGVVLEDEVQSLIDARIESLPAPEPSAGQPAGSPMVLRFDDGYVNNLTNAAPILDRFGMRGTLYTATHPTEWLGGSHGGHAIMTAAQLRELHQTHGWEIAGHTRTHADANNGDPAVWLEGARQSAQDMLDIGLPWPRSFAYPNGSRNVATDRGVYRLHDFCGLTGHPSRTPVKRDAPAFFTGWATINGLSPAADMERAKAYLLDSRARGEVPVLGFHGITDGTPDAAHHLSRGDFEAIISWAADQGFTTITQSEMTPHNILKDPGFETRAVGYPWVTSGGGWTRTRSTAAGHTGWMGMDLASGATGTLYQVAPADPGRQYRLRVRFGAGRTITAGRVDVVATPQDPTGAGVGDPTTFGPLSSGTTEADVTGLVTMPPGAASLRVAVQPTGWTGTGVRVVHVAMYRSDLHDPLA